MTGKRLLAVLGTLAFIGWQVFAVAHWGAEKVQGRVYVATALVSLVFIALYSRDPWWKAWFGRSLMLIAVAMFGVGLQVVLYRFVGPDYWGRGFLIVLVADLTLLAMVVRTAVLWVAQRNDEHKADPRP